jgi:exopolysaccharide production protein ExoY
LIKRTFDAVGSLTLLALSSPLLVVTALAVKLTSPGPVLFGHARCGRGGRKFQCWKFRTMVEDAEDWLARDPALRAAHRSNGFKLPLHADPRVTRLGKFLRFTHLDELPQLLNVLKGDMSLVGPRPIVDEELAWYGDRSADLLSVRPGVFGPWTAQGKRRMAYPERAQVELHYVENGTFLGDCKILLRHLPILMSGQREEEVPAEAKQKKRKRPARTARVA